MKQKVMFNTTPNCTELSIETEKVYTIRYYHDGRGLRLVNFWPVTELPNTPAVKKLREVAQVCGNKIARLHEMEFDGQEYRQLWHEIKALAEA